MRLGDITTSGENNGYIYESLNENQGDNFGDFDQEINAEILNQNSTAQITKETREVMINRQAEGKLKSKNMTRNKSGSK